MNLKGKKLDLKENFLDWLHEAFSLYKKTFFTISLVFIALSSLLSLIAINTPEDYAPILFLPVYLLSPLVGYYCMSLLIKYDDDCHSLDNRFDSKKMKKMMILSFVVYAAVQIVSIAMHFAFSSEDGGQKIELVTKDFFYYFDYFFTSFNVYTGTLINMFLFLIVFLGVGISDSIGAFQSFVFKNLISVFSFVILFDLLFSLFEEMPYGFILKSFANPFFLCFTYVVYKHAFLDKVKRRKKTLTVNSPLSV